MHRIEAPGGRCQHTLEPRHDQPAVVLVLGRDAVGPGPGSDAFEQIHHQEQCAVVVDPEPTPSWHSLHIEHAQILVLAHEPPDAP